MIILHHELASDAISSKKSRKLEVRKIPENFLFYFDFTINSEYVILFQFESDKKSSKKKEEKFAKTELSGW